MIRQLFLCAAAASLLASCAAGPQRPRTPTKILERALATAPGAAQPSRIVAAEIAFARAAREDGQWTAFRQFSGPGAIIHGASGGVAAEGWLARRADPDDAVQWAPRTIWMSCDAQLAVSQGRFVTPEGTVGTFVTVWQRQRDEDYRWVYDAAAGDDPQPPKKIDAPLAKDEIVVTAIDSVKGLVADCPRSGDERPVLPPELSKLRGEAGGWTAPDGTLSFHWRHTGAGTRELEAWYLADGAWQQALYLAWPPAQG